MQSPFTAAPLPSQEQLVASIKRVHSRPLRICTVAYTFYYSDARVMRYNKSLAARGDHVDIIALREPGRPRTVIRDGVTVIGIQTRSVNERSRLSYLFRILLFFIRALIVVSCRQLRCRYDLVHVHSVPDFLVFSVWLAKLMGAKLILDIHDLLPELYASKFRVQPESVIFKLLLTVERVSASFVDHVISANDLWQQRLVARSVAPGKATVLLNFPDRTLFYPRGRTRTDDRFIMIYPGTLNWHQGLDIAIEAFNKVRHKIANSEFHIYGVGPALPALIKLVRDLNLRDSVRFQGLLSLEEISVIIENADLGIVPKRKDSFGNEAFSTKTLEFMALGVPVIVADTRVDSYYFNDSLVRFFRSGDRDDLADAMLELMTSRQARELRIQNGLEYVRLNCWEAKRHLYLDLVDSLCQKYSSLTKKIQ